MADIVTPAAELPPELARRLAIYAEKIVPAVTKRKADWLFSRQDGQPKTQWTLASQIRGALRRELGIAMSPHQFRHLDGKIILDADPGAHETVRQFLGHKNLKTTVNAYTGVNRLRAGRLHARLIEQLQQPKQDPPRGMP